MKACAILFCAALLGGCASTTPLVQLPAAPQLFHDQLFDAPARPVDTGHIFAVNAEMRAYLQREVSHNLLHKDVRRQLFEALYRKDKLQLEYDAAMTRDAAETFAARSGNCLSLAIMTAALAHELNLNVQFQQVQVDESWSRAGDLYFASNHVNLTLGQQRTDLRNGFGIDLSSPLTVDFIPISARAREHATPLDEATVVAMYLNNRSAELLVQGQYDQAYWMVRKAIEQAPAFLHAYNTLAVIYRRHGNLPEAERTLRYALQQRPDNVIVLSNLAQTLESQEQPDKRAEAAQLRLTLAQLEPEPPFYYFSLGQTAMRLGDFQRARELFRRELARVPDYHEFHFWLALADYRLGYLSEADVHMVKALANSTTRSDHDLYAAKLDKLRAYEAAILQK
ncbi:tetratricopeptide repeat protein [Pseudoduganella sp. FT93W]|uniref:Tetratricopeptide repeat protein n=1 Tax=Duganella fentianensis TaxID=2692177 RepID=A0A845HVQ3_9BURK|nr:tetratricopeptide repeat protein [Duganella fentianensis]MYN43747.1 tetratricopeptide repeat protein [Duganella fentianensis]